MFKYQYRNIETWNSLKEPPIPLGRKFRPKGIEKKVSQL